MFGKIKDANKIDSVAESRLKLLTILVKHSTLDFSQSSEYASVIYNSLFGKIEDANKTDSIAM